MTYTTITSNVGTNGTMTVVCFRHTICFDHARANQHQRTEYGSCAYCGKKYKRVIWWAKKEAPWWTTEDEAA